MNEEEVNEKKSINSKSNDRRIIIKDSSIWCNFLYYL